MKNALSSYFYKITVLFVLFTGLLTTPFATGMITAQRIEDLAIQYRLNPNINHIEVDIQRGWFHSEITSTVKVHVAEFSSEDFELMLHHSVRHGPILWGDSRPLAFGFTDVKTDIELPANMQNKLTEMLARNVNVLSQLHYDGSQSSTLSIPKFTHLSKDHTQITFHPLTLEAHSNLPVSQVQATLNWQGIELSKGDHHVKIGQSLSHVDMQKEGVIWTGAMDWYSDILQLSQSSHTLQIKQVNIKAQTLMDEQQRISSSQSLHIESLNNQGIRYGPGKYTAIVNHIPLAVFEKLAEMQQQIFTLPTAQQEQAIGNMGFSMFMLLPDILAAEPEIALRDVLLTTPNGDIQGELHITLTGLNRQDMMNFSKIKKHIRADMQLSFPAVLVSSSSYKNIKDFMQKGWLIKENNMLHSALHMADGVLTINKQTIPLPF